MFVHYVKNSLSTNINQGKKRKLNDTYKLLELTPKLLTRFVL